MLALVAVLVGVLGLAVGSFLNVVIWRVPRGESVVTPPSHCPGCDTAIRGYDNVPLVSWLLLHGQCRSCGTAISARYPAVEALTAALFVGMAVSVGVHPALPAFLYLAAIGVALAFIDLDVKRLPDVIVLPSYAVAAVLLAVAAVAGKHPPHQLIGAVVGCVALYAFYFLLAVLKPGGMGFGDVKLAGVLGLYLGFLGWGPLVVGAFLAFLVGGLSGIALMATHRAGRKSKIPFGPFMIVGSFVGVFAGHPLAHLYVSTLRR
jgi:leader peptidase (prepilin peptidase)/N-methyltransferase